MIDRKLGVRWIGVIFLAALAGCSTSTNPAAPPAPPAEIPSFLTIPSNVTIGIDELKGGGAGGLTLKDVTTNLRDEIQNTVGVVEELNLPLDGALSVFRNQEIPVDPNVFTHEFSVSGGGVTSTVKIDFRPFDLDGAGGVEACSGCTCPVGCAPDLTECPSEAPEADLKPICIRIWHNDRRFVAGLLNRPPTPENPESGALVMQFLSEFDLVGSLFAFTYDHHDPQDKTTDLSAFLKDEGFPDFFGRIHTFAGAEGPAASAKKTFRLSDEFTQSTGASLFQGQAQFLADQDPLLLETTGSGFFDSFIEDITPPICTSVLTASPIAEDICTGLGLSLTPGNFPPLPELDQVQLPPVSEFPETPGF